MPPVISALANRFPSFDGVRWRATATIVLLAALHVAALDLMRGSEDGFVGWLFFVGAWAMLNFFFLALTRRPAVSATLSLTLIAALIALSRFKSDNLWMTVSFIDVMVIDVDTI